MTAQTNTAHHQAHGHHQVPVDNVVSSPSANSARYDANEVGLLFLQEYYTFMNREPHRLHCFYNKKSTFLHGREGENAKICNGQQEIHDRIMELGLNNCRVLVSNIDTQLSLNGGIVIQVLGELSNNGGASHKFTQTFFLAEQTQGFYVLNDIFRFLKEDVDNHYEETEEPLVDQQHGKHPTPSANGTSQQQKVVTPKPESVSTSTFKTVEHPKKTPSSASSPVAPSSPKKEHKTSSVPIVAAVAVTTQESAPVASTEKTKVAEPKPATAGALDSKKEQHHKQQKAAAKSEEAAPVPETATPAKTTSWAKMAASNVDKFANELSPAKGKVLNNTISSSAPESNKSAGVSDSSSRPNTTQKKDRKDKKDKSKDNQVTQAEDQEQSAGDDFHPVTGRNKSSSNKDNTGNGSGYEKEKFSVYIKALADGTTSKQVSDALSKVGAVKSVDILASRNIAFVEFEKMEHATKAIGMSFVVNGATLLAEERRKNNNNHHQGGSNNNKKKDFSKSGGGNRSFKKNEAGGSKSSGSGKQE